MFFKPSIEVTAYSVFAILTMGLAASAEDGEPDYSRTGFYVGAGVQGGSYTEMDNDVEGQLKALGYSVSVDTDDAVGFDVVVGYRGHARFAIELEFEMLPSTDVDVESGGVGLGDAFEIETWAVTENLKIFLLTGRVQPFVVAGIGLLHAKIEDDVGGGLSESDTKFAVRAGGGFDVYITEHVAVWARATYLYRSKDLVGLDFSYVTTGGGLQYRF